MSYRVSLGEVTFPVAPSNMKIQRKSRNRTVDLLDGTQAVLCRAPSLCEYRMELLLPAREYPFSDYPSGFVAPEEYISAVEGYANRAEEVTLTIERDRSMERCTVCVEDVSYTEDTKHGDDVVLSITLREVKTNARTGSRTIPNTYTVREGESLRLIAKRIWGDETLWNYLYGYNVDAIEAAAKAQGYPDSRFGERLMPNLTLVVPQGVV